MSVLPEARLALAKKHAAPLSDGGRRKWLTCEVASYGSDSEQTTLHVLEGSPPRGFIIEQPSSAMCVLIDMRGDIVGTTIDDFTGFEWKPRWRVGRKSAKRLKK